MTTNQLFQIFFYIFCLLLAAPILGKYMADIYTGKKNFAVKLLSPLEKLIYKLSGVNAEQETGWREYTKSLIIFNLIGIIFVFALQLLQKYLPLNPNGAATVKWDLAFNTAVSFVTNTNWQAYSGESTLSYLTQMLGLGVQNFLSAATGMAVLLAFIRGLTRANNPLIGNFWADITKTIVYILLPLSLFLAIALTSQGVVQTFKKNVEISTIETASVQQIPLGPAASQIAIKQLGTNGGGFYGVNSAHPLENPTPLSNFLEMFSILLLPAACVFMFGFMTKEKKHAAILFIVMFALLAGGIGLALYGESMSAKTLGVNAVMEGKETRFGVVNSVLWAVSTTAASNGSVNAMHSSLSPISGGVALFNMLSGEVIFGGIGCGLYGMLIFVILTVFICGLLVGRTPQYFGKKIEKLEVQMSVLVILLPALCILFGASAALFFTPLKAYIFSAGPHGFSEVLYAFASAAGNNGSAFAGLNVNNTFYNLTLSIAMFVGRFGIIIPCMILAGNMAAKKKMAQSIGNLQADDMLFGILLLGIVVIFGVLTYFPALMLGPALETLLNI